MSPLRSETCVFVFFLLLAGSNEFSIHVPTALNHVSATEEDLSSLGPGCSQCEYSNIWNDVIYLIDTSSENGNVADIWRTVQSVTPYFNVQKSGYEPSKYTMHVGVIAYASKANLVASLGSVDGTDIEKMTIPYDPRDKGTNLESAIQMASEQFNSPAHRINSKPVIVIMSTAYSQGEFDSPMKSATAFKEDGGVIIVYDQLGGDVETIQYLNQLASPGYFYSSTTGRLTALVESQCSANCFCPSNAQPFTNGNKQNLPIGGCYNSVLIHNNYVIAKQNCANHYNSGMISTDRSQAKNEFLQNGYTGPASYYIGLEYDQMVGNWVWADGTPLSGDYQPWYGGVRPTGSADKACVYVVNATGEWVPTDCRNGFYYTCESRPCDSSHYCDVVTQ